MNSPGRHQSSPAFKNLNCRLKHSPIELKEKMRKDYKSRIHNSRDMLLNRFRDLEVEINIRNTLTEIYEKMFNFFDHSIEDDEENKLCQEIKKELVEEEFQWFLEEYEKSHNFDWSLLEQDSIVICPVCKKNNIVLQNNILSCSGCNIHIITQNTLVDIKRDILNSVESHSIHCNEEAQFTLVPELKETHIYLICNGCNELQLVV